MAEKEEEEKVQAEAARAEAVREKESRGGEGGYGKGGGGDMGDRDRGGGGGGSSSIGGGGIGGGCGHDGGGDGGGGSGEGDGGGGGGRGGDGGDGGGGRGGQGAIMCICLGSCVSNITAISFIQEALLKAREMGLRYEGSITAATTHILTLVGDPVPCDKLNTAHERGIPVVSYAWLQDSIEQHTLLPFDTYIIHAMAVPTVVPPPSLPPSFPLSRGGDRIANTTEQQRKLVNSLLRMSPHSPPRTPSHLLDLKFEDKLWSGGPAHTPPSFINDCYVEPPPAWMRPKGSLPSVAQFSAEKAQQWGWEKEGPVNGNGCWTKSGAPYGKKSFQTITQVG
jgi:hypothetical protein